MKGQVEPGPRPGLVQLRVDCTSFVPNMTLSVIHQLKSGQIRVCGQIGPGPMHSSTACPCTRGEPFWRAGMLLWNAFLDRWNTCLESWRRASDQVVPTNVPTVLPTVGYSKKSLPGYSINPFDVRCVEGTWSDARASSVEQPDLRGVRRGARRVCRSNSVLHRAGDRDLVALRVSHADRVHAQHLPVHL
jgi:hypothetical protein